MSARSGKILGTMAAFAAATALLAPSASAQQQTDYLSVTVRGGSIAWDESASMDATGFVGLDGQYAFSKYFGIGTGIMVGRGNTQKDDFLTTLTFGDRQAGDTTSFFYVGQPVSIVDLSLYGMLQAPVSERFQPYAIGGVGVTSMFLDPQINRGERRVVNTSLQYGAGFWFRFTEQTGIQFDIRALTLTDYDRSLLDPTAGRNPNITFVEDFPAPPEDKSSVTNWTFSLGFRYIPGFFGEDF
jgi:hypothetical protein